MILTSYRIIILTIIFTAFLSLSCKDDNITNIYLNITGQSRIDEASNLNSDNKLINITVYDSKSGERIN